MRRRDIVAGMGAVAALAAGRVRAQQRPTVAILSGTNREPRLVGAIQEGLSDAGYVEGRSVTLAFSGAEGNFDRLPALMDDLVRREVAVIIAIQSANAPRVAKAATATIPIVFCIGGDPVRLGLVSSLSRPGGNVTGTTFLVNTLGGKRLDVLRELLPATTSIGLLANPKNPAAASETADVQTGANALGLTLYRENASGPDEIEAAFASFARQKVGAVTFAADAVFNARRLQLIALAARYAIPTMYFYRAFAEGGGLISYGGADTDAYRLAGVYAGRILRGEKPADLPVQQSTKIELVVNARTAKALGLEIPASILARADEVIE
jgi:putative ABC transport system substrate-binding protein